MHARFFAPMRHSLQTWCKLGPPRLAISFFCLPPTKRESTKKDGTMMADDQEHNARVQMLLDAVNSHFTGM